MHICIYNYIHTHMYIVCMYVATYNITVVYELAIPSCVATA